MKSPKLWFLVLCLGIYISFRYTIYFFESMGNGEWINILRLTAIFTMLCTYGYIVIATETWKTAKFSAIKIKIVCWILILFSISASGSAFILSKNKQNSAIYTKSEGYNILLERKNREEGILKNQQLELMKINSTTYDYNLNTIEKEYNKKIEDITKTYQTKIKSAKKMNYITTPEIGVNALTKKMNTKINNLNIEKNKKIKQEQDKEKKDNKDTQIKINNINKKIEKTNKDIKETETEIKEYSKNYSLENSEVGYELFFMSLLGENGRVLSGVLYLILSILLEVIIMQLIKYVFITMQFKISSFFDYAIFRIIKMYATSIFTGISTKTMTKITSAKLKKNPVDMKMKMEMESKQETKQETKQEQEQEIKIDKEFINDVYKKMKETKYSTGQVRGILFLSKQLNKTEKVIRAAHEVLKQEKKIITKGKKTYIV